MKTNTRILLVEDSPRFREVLAFGLDDEPDMTIIGQFNTAEAALQSLTEQLTTTTPDLVLLDLCLPGISGLEAIPQFKELCPHAEILILTQSNKEEDIISAISNGAVGYLLKESSLSEITDGIRTITQGGTSLDPVMMRYVLNNQRKVRISADNDSNLSTRELQVLSLLAEGKVQKQIAGELNISPKTVGFHIGHLYLKLEVKNAPEAVHKAHQMGLFS